MKAYGLGVQGFRCRVGAEAGVSKTPKGLSGLGFRGSGLWGRFGHQNLAGGLGVWVLGRGFQKPLKGLVAKSYAKPLRERLMGSHPEGY